MLTIADDEQSWAIFTDSKRAASTRLRKVAAAWGVEPERQGAGWRCVLPLKAVRFSGPKKPPSARQIRASQEAGVRLRQSKSSPTGTALSLGIVALALFLVLGLAGPARAVLAPPVQAAATVEAGAAP